MSGDGTSERSEAEPPAEGVGSGARPEDVSGDGTSGDDWDPDGVDLAKALVARAKASGRNGPRPFPARRSRRTGARFRQSAGSGWSGPGSDERDPKPLGAAVEKLASEHGWEEELSVHGVVARWDELVGAEMAAHVRPESYDQGVLTARADSTAWATQVRLLAAELVRKLNQEIGHGTVTRVNVLGPQSRNWSAGPRRVPGRGPRDTYG